MHHQFDDRIGMGIQAFFRIDIAARKSVRQSRQGHGE